MLFTLSKEPRRKIRSWRLLQDAWTAAQPCYRKLLGRLRDRHWLQKAWTAFLTDIHEPQRKLRNRGNPLAGKIWLLLFFVTLLFMHFAASFIIPLIGAWGGLYRSALIIGIIWNAVLITAIFRKQNWARFILAGFLMTFAFVQCAYVPDALIYYPDLRGMGIQVVLALCLTDIFIAVFLIVSPDIRSLSRPLVRQLSNRNYQYKTEKQPPSPRVSIRG